MLPYPIQSYLVPCMYRRVRVIPTDIAVDIYGHIHIPFRVGLLLPPHGESNAVVHLCDYAMLYLSYLGKVC